jgi:hypothetical protein
LGGLHAGQLPTDPTTITEQTEHDEIKAMFTELREEQAELRAR